MDDTVYAGFIMILVIAMFVLGMFVGQTLFREGLAETGIVERERCYEDEVAVVDSDYCIPVDNIINP